MNQLLASGISLLVALGGTWFLAANAAEEGMKEGTKPAETLPSEVRKEGESKKVAEKKAPEEQQEPKEGAKEGQDIQPPSPVPAPAPIR